LRAGSRAKTVFEPGKFFKRLRPIHLTAV
jgi:hypothetical protein